MNNISILADNTFDFTKNKVEQLDLATLQRTQKPNDIYGNPLKGIYHFQVINQVLQICEKYRLNYAVEEIFAAQNASKTLPGVIRLPEAEKEYGVNAVEAHILNRIFTTIRINDHETDELTTTIAIAYHQSGIQFAIGPCVKICHNQCILTADRTISDFGKNKVPTEQLFTVLNEWLKNFDTDMNKDREHIKRLKAKIVTHEELYTYIGILTSIRVASDSSDKELSKRIENTYPLNQGQITLFTEDALKLYIKRQKEDKPVTAWDLYNIATELYKPGKTDISVLIPQNLSFMDTLNQFCGL